jgi:predicted DNA-binding mobile mystery protein A
MRNNYRLLIAQLDEKLKPFSDIEKSSVPAIGWIKTVRIALNMTMAQLGTRIGITRQGINQIEQSEARGTISLNALHEIGEALNLKFVYGYVAKDGSVAQLVNVQAERVATKIVMRTYNSMILEEQGINEEKIKDAISELTEEISSDVKRILWD